MNSILRRFQILLGAIALLTVEMSSAAPQELLPAVTFQSVGGFAAQDWPADFNRDGITDLVGRHDTSGAIQVALGNADGTFRPTVASATNGHPKGVGDVNGDGRVDVIAQVGSTVMVLPGTGTASLGSARTVLAGFAEFAIVADMNGDDLRDVVIGEQGESLHVVPGNGDFTFQPVVTITTGTWPHGATVADFNGDGRRDVAIAHRYDRKILVFLNNGGLLFTPTSYAIEFSTTDVTARDFNGDGHLDLAVSARGTVAAPHGTDDGPWDAGFVYVYEGNGDGTFATPTAFRSGIGAHSVVAGDFTHDGVTDLATLNGPDYIIDNPCGNAFGQDTLSILPGAGDGTFGRATTFDLNRQRIEATLNTNDVNRDGFPDLLTGLGKIALTAAPRANRPPVVTAGEDQTVIGSNEAALRGSGVDPDGHRLAFAWSDQGPVPPGFPPGPPDPCYFPDTVPGTYTLTLTADDGQGGVASDDLTLKFEHPPSGPDIFVPKPAPGEVLTVDVPYTLVWEASDPDGIQRIDVFFAVDATNVQPIPECTDLPGTARECTWNRPGPLTERGQIIVRAIDTTGLEAANSSARFPIRPPGGGGGLPGGWDLADVGAVGASGSANHDNGTFTVRGSGADIWDAADEFHWAFTAMTGNFDVTTRVVSVQNVNQWTKAGLMIRADTTASSVHASLFATPTTVKGLAFQRRRSFGGTSVHTAGPSLTAPVWIRLSRRGTTITASYRKAITDPWTRIGTDSISVLPDRVLVGLAVSSHVDGTLATATFDNVEMLKAPAFAHVDIGAVGVAGNTTTDGVVVTQEGSGADIWGTADAFRFYHTPWTGDGTFTARVRSIENTHAWAKAGVMFRESMSAGSKHVMAIVSPGKGLAMQYRTATGGTTANAALRAGAAPEWLRLTRAGNVFTGFASNDGVTWTQLGSVTISMGATISVGLPVTSHNNATLATAQFDDVSIRR